MGQVDVDEQYFINSISKVMEDGFLTTNHFNHKGDHFLSHALKKGNLKLAKYLVRQKGFDINAPNNYGLTPLAVMINRNDFHMVLEMLDLGVDVNFKFQIVGEKLSPLLFAIEESVESELDMVELLLQNGANSTEIQVFSYIIKSYEFDCPKRCMYLILKYGVELEETSDETALSRKYFIFCKAIADGNTDLVKQMLLNISDVDFKQIDDIPPSFFCAYFNKAQILEILIENGADLSLRNYEISHIPVKVDSTEIAEVLIKNNMLHYIKQPPEDSNLITLAFEAGHTKIIDLLYKYDIMSKINADNFTLLHWAAVSCQDINVTENHKKIFEFIIKAEICDINAKNKDGMTALNLIVLNNCEIIAMFLEHGADPGISNYHNDCRSHSDCDDVNCYVLKYFEKVSLLDEDFVNINQKIILDRNINLNFKEIDKFEIYQQELENMKSIKISNRTVAKPAMSLFDFLFLNPIFAARYSLNQVVNNIYNENNRDFENCFPCYGFALNFHFKKGLERNNLMNLAQDLMEKALGTSVSPEIVDYVFKYTSNKKMKSLLS